MSRRRARGPPQLPTKQLAILAICRFAEPVAMTSVFPYLPEMIESFGVEKKEVAKWAGITSAVFSLSQGLTAILWGRASDRFGRKPMILLGFTFTMLTSLAWGISTSLPMAIGVRAVAGISSGNVGIIRTMVAEMVPEKELQPRAFSIMPLVWSLGSIFGPSFGGFFAKPAENFPRLFGHSWLFLKYPFLFPNIVASVLFLMGITIGILFLKETLETKRHRTDFGRALGYRLITLFKIIFRFKETKKPFRRHSAHDSSSASLLRPTSSAGSDASKLEDFSPLKTRATKPPLPHPTLAEVFTRQAVINLVAYTLLCLHSGAYDQLLPIFLHHPRQQHTPHNTHLPFQFSGGFGLGSSRIGTLFTLNGIIGCVIQFLIFPPTARRFGVLYCFKCCACVFPLICLVTPYTALIVNESAQQAAMFAILIVKNFAIIFATPCSIILLTNSAVSLRILGTLNGFAVSISAVGRAIGPAIGGASFTWGLEHGYMITPWWLLGCISIVGAVPIWYLVEMDGFSKSGDAGSGDDEFSSDEDDGLPSIDEEHRGDILEGDEVLGWDPRDDVFDAVSGSALDQVPSRRKSEEVIRAHKIQGGRRRSSTYLDDRISSPIGLRGGSVQLSGDRRLSNELAASNLGHGTGGASFA